MGGAVPGAGLRQASLVTTLTPGHLENTGLGQGRGGAETHAHSGVRLEQRMKLIRGNGERHPWTKA